VFVKGECYIGTSQILNQRGLFARDHLKSGFIISDEELIHAAQVAQPPFSANAKITPRSNTIRITKKVNQFDEIFIEADKSSSIFADTFFDVDFKS